LSVRPAAVITSVTCALSALNGGGGAAHEMAAPTQEQVVGIVRRVWPAPLPTAMSSASSGRPVTLPEAFWTSGSSSGGTGSRFALAHESLALDRSV